MAEPTTGGSHDRDGVELMRCDLHVHSWYSGRAGVPVLDHLGRECYSDPLEVHERARLRGMDLVTLTDHDTVEGAMRLVHRDECFLSEELTVHLAGGRQLHVNVFGIPLFTLGVYAHELAFGRRFFRAFQEAFGWPAPARRRRPALGAPPLEEVA